jgi:hypothetical protein
MSITVCEQRAATLAAVFGLEDGFNTSDYSL